ncbi:hypothetical protein BGZ83_002143, partial [Gryganskiella cystojenkinii]
MVRKQDLAPGVAQSQLFLGSVNYEYPDSDDENEESPLYQAGPLHVYTEEREGGEEIEDEAIEEGEVEEEDWELVSGGSEEWVM